MVRGIIVALDLPTAESAVDMAEEVADQFRSSLGDTDVILISAVTGRGVKRLLSKMVQLIDQDSSGD